MVPPNTIPPIGTTATPVNGTTPLTRIGVSVATAPTPMDTVTHAPDHPAPLRRAAVTTAAPNMTPSTNTDDHNRDNATANTNATTVSCPTARTAAPGATAIAPNPATR
ncbi:hypothetical protein Ntsu_35930 [Nocardia sp. IFM 10818]